jgi:hypothetical protein
VARTHTASPFAQPSLGVNTSQQAAARETGARTGIEASAEDRGRGGGGGRDGDEGTGQAAKPKKHPPGPSGSTIAGILLFGLIFLNSSENWSPGFERVLRF